MHVLIHVHIFVGVNVSVIMCILVWIHVPACVALPIVVGVSLLIWKALTTIQNQVLRPLQQLIYAPATMRASCVT